MPAWNRDGEELEDCNALQAAVSLVDPNANAWRRDKNLPPRDQGLVTLGHARQSTSVHLGEVGRGVGSTLDRIPVVANLQAWLLLFFCAVAKTKFLLRTVRPEFARDAQIRRCFRSVLG